jgi:hypothetical protein
VRRRVEIIADIAIIVFVVASGGIYLRERILSQRKQQDFAGLQPGEQLPQLPGYEWASHRLTLVLGLKNGCRFCDESMPFYKKLVQLRRSGEFADVELLAVLPDERNSIQLKLRTEGLDLDFIASYQLSKLKVSATPTLILVSRNGRFLKAWVGRLRGSEENDVIESVKQNSARYPISLTPGPSSFGGSGAKVSCSQGTMSNCVHQKPLDDLGTSQMLIAGLAAFANKLRDCDRGK